MDKQDRYEIDDEPIHLFFGLSYSNYLVIQRSLLQSMPVEWQRKFVKLLEEMNEHFGYRDNGSFRVNRIDSRGKFMKDPLANYDRGRRRVTKEDLEENT
jgi:hypothetical protein